MTMFSDKQTKKQNPFVLQASSTFLQSKTFILPFATLYYSNLDNFTQNYIIFFTSAAHDACEI